VVGHSDDGERVIAALRGNGRALERIEGNVDLRSADSSPRPISLEAASAANSVTRTASSARLRSMAAAASTAFESINF
jgi:hypothetical protein